MKIIALIASFAVSMNLAASEIPEIVKDHAPVFVSRRDQLRRPNSDRLLGLGYSVRETKRGEIAIRYTAFFSDEDSIRTAKKGDHQMARYGRRLDVEWAYEVRVDPRTGAARRRRYQCAIAVGIGHRTCVFRGRFHRESKRPILYVTARHNVFGTVPDLPYGSRRGKLIVTDPEFEIPFPKSRDMIPLEKPEFLRQSDEELLREGKLSRPSTEYAYLRVRGTLIGNLHLIIEAPDGTVFQNGSVAANALREMGFDLWGRESVVAIALPKEIRFALKNGFGQFRLGTGPTTIVPLPNRLKLEEVGLYLVDRTADGEYATANLSDRIRCADSTDLATCVVN